MRKFYIYPLLFCIVGLNNFLFSQITVSTGTPVNTLVQNVLVGQGVTVNNVTYIGNPNSIGHFQTGAVPSNLGISEGIIMSTGLVNGTPPIGSPVNGFVSTDNYLPGDALLGSLITGTTYDATILEFDFVPLSDTIKFRYVFGSEEYNEFVGSIYNDVFGFFISGLHPVSGFYTNYNIARIPGTTTPVAINTINGGSYSQYYVNNEALNGQSVVFDGFTTVLTAWAVVVPCATYHLKIAIADVGDGVYDSAVFLEANSFSSDAVDVTYNVSLPAAGNDAVEGCNNAVVQFSLPYPTPVNRVVPFIITGTATNGVDYQNIPNSVTIPAGQSSTTLTIIPIYDAVTEPTETINLNVQTSICTNTNITVNIEDYTMVSATGTGSTTICSGGGPVAIGVTASGGKLPYTYAWNNGLSAGTSHSVSPSATTTYIVTVSDLCGYTATSSVTVTVALNANITISPVDPVICLGETVALTASGGQNYSWSSGQSNNIINVAPVASTVYYVTGTDNFGCTGTASVNVTVNPTLNVIITPSSNSICEGDTIQLSATSNGTIPSFTWSNNMTGTPISVFPLTTTTYTVDVVDINTCTGSAQITINVSPVPQVEFSAFPVSGCSPLSVSFQNLSDPGDVQWQFGNGQTSVLLNPFHNYINSGIYSVTLTINNQGCENTLSKSNYIRVFPDVQAGFVPSENIVYEDESLVSFFDVSTGGTDWYWNFGTGNSNDFSTLQNPEFTFPSVGQYHVWLFVQNEWGCSDSVKRVIIVKPLITYYFPNAFTPNGDGINEVFMPYGNGVDPDNYELIIYNRWGKQVFRTTNVNMPWDGKYDGRALRTDVYIYHLKATFDGIIKTFEGNVLLIF